MKLYEKPILIEEQLDIIDIICISANDGTTTGSLVSINDLDWSEWE